MLACMEREELAPAYRGYALACYDLMNFDCGDIVKVMFCEMTKVKE